MSQNYVTFKKFPDATEARAQQQFLIDNGIECIFINTSPAMGSAMAGELSREYEIQLHPESFEQAGVLYLKQAESMMADLPEDYYLLDFSDDELQEVILKHDEWSEFDYLLARKLLADRGKDIDESLIKALRKQRIEDLAKPEQDQTAWIAFGYLAALIGGFFGVITGYVLWSSQKTLPNGQVVYTYNAKDRMHGKNILILGCIMIPVIIAIKFLIME